MKVDMKAKIVVVGSLNMDLVVPAPRIPKPGETILGAGELQMIPGGKGANQSYGSARLGADVAMVGRVGDDAFGKELRENLGRVSVNTHHVTRDADTSTGVALIVVEESGQNSIVVSPGANGRVSPADVERAEEVTRPAHLLLLQLEIPLPAVIRAAQLARRHGVRVVLIAAPAQPLPAELLSLVDILIPNETEAGLLSGHAVGTDDEMGQAAAILRQSGVKTIIMTMGSRGSLLITDAEMSHFPAIPIEPVDTTAAGDAFVSGFAVALAEGMPMPAAVRHGNAAGALAATRLGAQPSMPGRDDLERMLTHARTTPLGADS